MKSINPKGEKASSDWFTGSVYSNMVISPEDNLDSVIGKVTFEAKARTNWHRHPHGQILIVLEGIGYYQEKGKPIELIRHGDVVKIPVDVEHWHGASHHSSMVHIAIVPGLEKGVSDWLQPVTDKEYDNVSY